MCVLLSELSETDLRNSLRELMYSDGITDEDDDDLCEYLRLCPHLNLHILGMCASV